MKVAIVHDYLNQRGGAERVVEILHEIFPDAPIFTSFYIPDTTFESFRVMDVRVSFMQKLPFISRYYKNYLFAYPKAFASFDLSDYDVVLSSSSAFAKGVRIKSGSLHISYCHTPARFLWMYREYIRREKFDPITKMILPYFISKLKEWDIKTSKKVDYFIANSNLISRRIKDIYDRDSEVVYPPIDVSKFQISDSADDYFLIVSRLVTYKRIDIAVEAFNNLGIPLKIVGVGWDMAFLKKIAGTNIEFLGSIDDNDLKVLYSKCRALIFPGFEDLGIVPLEAQASGRPVIAYGAGGSLETIVDGRTGIFFSCQTADSLADAVKKFEKMKFDSKEIRNHAGKFDKEMFKKKIYDFVVQKYSTKLI